MQCGGRKTPVLIYSADYISLLALRDHRRYSENPEVSNGLETHLRLLLYILIKFLICAGLYTEDQLHLNILNLSVFSLAFIVNYKGSLKKINDPELYSLTNLLSCL